MLSKEEQKKRNQEFWGIFRKEMRKIASSNGRGINWINYPTDVRDFYVRMETSGKDVRFCLDLQPKDDGIRSILWEQLIELRKVMENDMGSATAWNEFDRIFSGRTISRIVWINDTLNFYKNDDLSEIRAFFRDKLIAFDAFYQEYKDILISLAE